MPRYYLHIRDGDRMELDLEGSVFADVERARQEAVLSARELMAVKVAIGEKLNGHVFEITDEDGQVVAVVPFRSALQLE